MCCVLGKQWELGNMKIKYNFWANLFKSDTLSDAEMLTNCIWIGLDSNGYVSIVMWGQCAQAIRMDEK